MISIKYNKGFTLLELIVSLAITSMVMLGFFTIINSSIRSNSKNESDIKSLHMAQSEIESLRKQIKLGNDDAIKIIDSTAIDKTIVFDKEGVGKIKENNIMKDIEYKKDMGGKNYLINLEISRSPIDKYNGYIYNINVISRLYNKNKNDKETYISKKETRLVTKILSNKPKNEDIITPEYSNGNLFIRFREKNFLAGHYLAEHKLTNPYYSTDQVRSLIPGSNQNSGLSNPSKIKVIVENKDGKFNISGYFDENGDQKEYIESSANETKHIYYKPVSVKLDPKNHDGGSNKIEMTNIYVRVIDENGEEIHEDYKDIVKADDNPVEFKFDKDIVDRLEKLEVECTVKFESYNSTSHIVFGKGK